jgi:quercetin dioxygenase-like cupin family protein
MADRRTTPGKLVHVHRLEAGCEASQITTLLKTDNLHVIRLAARRGEHVPTHELRGEVIIHCLEGAVVLEALGRRQELAEGQLLHYIASEPFSVQAVDSALLVLTVALPHTGSSVELIG